MRKIILSGLIALLAVGLTAGVAFAKNPGKCGGKGYAKEKGSDVSQAVHKAHDEELKGKDLAESAHEAIEERKENKEAMKMKEDVKNKYQKMLKDNKRQQKGKLN